MSGSWGLPDGLGEDRLTVEGVSLAEQRVELCQGAGLAGVALTTV